MATQTAGFEPQLAADIRAAFASVEYPGDEALVYDETGSHLECNQVARAFRGRDWRDLNSDFLARNDSSLYFMSVDARRYFLPAFMLLCLEAAAGLDMAPLAIARVLSPMTQHGNTGALDSLRSSCSRAQRAAIESFLSWLAREFEGDFKGTDHLAKALEYWKESGPSQSPSSTTAAEG